MSPTAEMVISLISCGYIEPLGVHAIRKYLGSHLVNRSFQLKYFVGAVCLVWGL